MSTDHCKALAPKQSRVSFQPYQPDPLQRYSHPLLIVVVLCCVFWAAAGCGPESSSVNNEQLTAETQRIAQEYEASRNLDGARSQLTQLAVANPEQWLLYVAEASLSDGTSQEIVNGLVRLSTDLGLQSASVIAYAEANGIIEQAAANSAAAVAQAVTELVDDTASQSTDTQIETNGQADQQSVNETNSQLASAGSAAADVAEQPATEAVAVADTPTPLPEEPTPLPTNTPVPKPVLQSQTLMNVRSGPGLAYAVIAALDPGVTADVLSKNPEGDWLQITLPDGQQGWVYRPLVTTTGDIEAVAVAANIPTPPPATNTPVPAPVAEAPAEPVAAAPEPAAPAPSGGPDFRLVEHRLRSVEENGGRFDGPSVICGEKHELTVEIVDANGAPLNGVAVEGIFTREVYVTGSQGKGDGRVEYVLWSGEDVKVIRDVDGREVSSDIAAGNTTRPAGISHDQLMQAGYCTDAADCQRFIDLPGCYGHHSWLARFQRSY